MPQIFLSYAKEDSFEASLLQEALESRLQGLNVRVWGFERDQARDERGVYTSLRHRVRESAALVILVSQFTLEMGILQWTELIYAEAFDVPIFILLHHVDFEKVRNAPRGVPPLVLTSQCTPACDWRLLDNDLRRCCINWQGGAGRETE